MKRNFLLSNEILFTPVVIIQKKIEKTKDRKYTLTSGKLR